MPTNIKVINNTSDRKVIAFNSENIGNSFLVPAGEYFTTKPGLWISWHQDKPLVIRTNYGLCSIWDDDWTIYGAWEDGDTVVLLGKGQGANGDVDLEVEKNGRLKMTKSSA